MSRYNENLDCLIISADISKKELIIIIDEAEKILNNENSTIDDKIQALLKKAQSLQKLEKLSESKAIIEKLLELKPEMPEALVRIGNVFREEKKYTESIEVITRSLNINAKYPYGYFMRAYTFHSMNEYYKALEDYNKAIELDQNLAIAYNNRGLIYFNISENEKAIADYSKVIELKPNLAEAYNNRGVIYRNIQDNDKALADCSKAIELKPNLAEAYNNRGAIYRNIQKNDKALADCSKAIELKPNYAEAYYNRGVIYRNIQKNEKAIADYSKAIELDQNLAMAYNNRGAIYRDISENDKAISDYSKAIELKPNYAEAYYNRGITYRDISENEKAIADYSKAIELKPDYAMAYNNRGITYRDISENEKAIADYSKAIELKPDYVMAYNNRGNIYSDIHENDKALADYNKAIELDQNSTMAYYNKSIIHIIKNDFKAAFTDILNYLHYCNFDKENMLEGLNDILSIIIKNKGIDFVWNIKANVDDIIKVPNYFIKLIGLFMKNGLTEKEYRDLFSGVLKLWKKCNEIENGILLFQYTTLPVLQSMFENQNFRLSPSTYLNDPKEGKALFDYLIESCREDKELASYYKKIEDKIKDEESITFVRCFTSRKDDLVMWDSSYGDLGRGVSIAIPTDLINKGTANPDLKNIHNIKEGKSKEEKNNIPMPFSMLGLFKIKYNKNCIDEISELFKKIKKTDFKNEKLLNLLSKLLLPITTLIKDTSREHENEYRLIYIFTNDNVQAKNFFKSNTKDGLYIETEKILFEKFDNFPYSYKDEYKHICIGPRVDEITYRKCVDSFKNKFDGIIIERSDKLWQ